MAWTIQKPSSGDNWKIPLATTDRQNRPVPVGGSPAGILQQHLEETNAVEQLNVLVEQINLLPAAIQSGGIGKWQKQKINLLSNWLEETFYTRPFKWIGDSFYILNYLGVWKESEFYPQSFRWQTDFFYPKNFLNVWIESANSERIISAAFYPQSFRWLQDAFYPKPLWESDGFYSKNYLNVWSGDSFYAKTFSWYVTEDCLLPLRLTFNPIGNVV